jgi:hypothetical protein
MKERGQDHLPFIQQIFVEKLPVPGIALVEDLLERCLQEASDNGKDT